jgi:hypothetical protein
MHAHAQMSAESEAAMENAVEGTVVGTIETTEEAPAEAPAASGAAFIFLSCGHACVCVHVYAYNVYARWSGMPTRDASYLPFSILA